MELKKVEKKVKVTVELKESGYGGGYAMETVGDIVVVEVEEMLLLDMMDYIIHKKFSNLCFYCFLCFEYVYSLYSLYERDGRNNYIFPASLEDPG